MATRRRYTLGEDQIIVEEVNMHQTNIRRGLLIASQRTGRSFNSVQKHWYAVLSKKGTAFRYPSYDIDSGSCNSEKRNSFTIFSRILKWLRLVK